MKELSEKRMIWILLIAILALAFLASLFLALPLLFVDEVEYDEGLMPTLSMKIGKLEGLGRFTSEYRARRKEIEEFPLVENVAFNYEKGKLQVDVAFKGEMVMLTDRKHTLLNVEDEIIKPEERDVDYLRRHLPVMEVSEGQLQYISRYGIEKQLSEVIDLILEIYHYSDYNDRLVGKVVYTGGTGEEFGHLAISSPSGDSVLHIRERLDAAKVIESLRLIAQDVSVLPDHEREYELRGNILMEQKRIVDGSR